MIGKMLKTTVVKKNVGDLITTEKEGDFCVSEK